MVVWATISVYQGYAQSEPEYGLLFRSHDVNKDMRTGVSLPVIKNLEGGVDISFQLLMPPNKLRFGYIFRMLLNDSHGMDFISHGNSVEGYKMTLVRSDSSSPIRFDQPPFRMYQKNEWMQVRVSCNPAQQKITIRINQEERFDTISTAEISTLKILFGASEQGRLTTTDVPNIAIRDLQIRNSRGNLLYHWEFRKHREQITYDLVKQEPLEVRHPIWLIDQHTKWRKRSVLRTRGRAFVNYLTDSSQFLVFSEDSIFKYSLRSNSALTQGYKSGQIHPSPNNQLLYHPYFREFWQYDPEIPGVSRYVPAGNKWTSGLSAQKEPEYWHHNKLVTADSAVFVFGGYGNYTYKNKLLRFDWKTQQWDSISLQGKILPRYLSAAGKGRNEKEWLIFGGYGNQSGKQEFSPHTLYDLYAVDLARHTVKLLWDKTSDTAGYTVGNSLVWQPDNNSFLTLCYPIHKYSTQLQLRQFSMADGTSKVLGDSIPYLFHDTKSYCDLYLDKASGELIAITSYAVSDSIYEHTLYSIGYPAIAKEDARVHAEAGRWAKVPGGWYWLFPGLAGLSWFLFRRHKKSDVSLKSGIDSQEESIEHLVIEPLTPKIVDLPITSRIQLLGGLKLINRESENISNQLTPTLKQLLAVIACYSAEGRGISSLELRNIMWPDKTEESARNNRGVSIKKLRTLLEQLDIVQVLNEGSNWKLVLENNAACDFHEVRRLLQKRNQLDQDEILQLLALSAGGPLLPDMEFDWLDKIKADYASKLIDLLLQIRELPKVKNNPALLLTLSDVILFQDPLHETALKDKVQQLSKTGKYSLAKAIYEKFKTEYELSLGQPFEKSFESMLLN